MRTVHLSPSMHRRRWLLSSTLQAALAVAASGGFAQTPRRARTPTVGVLWHAGSREEEGKYFDALIEGFRDLGYVDGQNIALEHRYPNEQYERFDSFATDLVSRKLVSQSALDQARARRDSAAGTNKQAAARLHLLLEGTRSEEVEQADATLKQVQAALVELQTSAARYVVKAPRAGRIEAIPYKLGERPAPGTPLIVMLADGVPYARVYIPEPLRTRFLPGTRTRIRVDGHDGDLTGVVRFVSAEAAFTPYYALTQRDRSRLSYLALIDLDEQAAATVPTGMPVQVELPAQGN